MRHLIELWLVMLIAVTGTTNALAADPAHLKKLRLLRACDGCDLSGAKLRYEDLKNASLVGANLAGSELKSADLSGANLTDANLTGANLSGADLNGAVLLRADLRDADVTNSNLLRSDLREADMSTIELAPERFDAATVCGTKVKGAVLDRDCH